MDATDVRLLQLLHEDGRRSFESMAHEVALSGSAVKRRIDRLEADGVLGGYGLLAAPAAFGMRTVTLDVPDAFEHGEEERALDRLADLPWAGAVFNRERRLGLIVWYADDPDLRRVKKAAAALAHMGRGMPPADLREYRGRPAAAARGPPPTRTEWRVLRALAGDPRAPLKDVARAAGHLERTTRRAIHRLAASGVARVVPQLQPAWSRGLILHQWLIYADSDAVLERAKDVVGTHSGVQRLTEPAGMSLWAAAPNLATVLRTEALLRAAGARRAVHLTPTLVRWRVPPDSLRTVP